MHHRIIAASFFIVIGAVAIKFDLQLLAFYCAALAANFTTAD